MKRGGKRLLSLLLCLVLTAALLPASPAYAEVKIDTVNKTITVTGVSEAILQSDMTCSGLIVWDDAKLIIPQGVTLKLSDGFYFYGGAISVSGTLTGSARK